MEQNLPVQFEKVFCLSEVPAAFNTPQKENILFDKTYLT
jgi:hypothetical protein